MIEKNVCLFLDSSHWLSCDHQTDAARTTATVYVDSAEPSRFESNNSILYAVVSETAC